MPVAVRRLRALGWTMPDIAEFLGVSRSSVSLWARDVPVAMGRRRLGPRVPNALERAKAAEIADLLEAGRAQIGVLSERDLLIAGAALYAGEGTKRDGVVAFTNSDPAMVALFCSWLRRFFQIDERRLRLSLYLHAGLDLDGAQIVLVGENRHSYRPIRQGISSGSPGRYSEQQA